MSETIGVVGVGYVGLPLAVGLAAAGFSVIAYDHSEARVAGLKNNVDTTDSVTPQQLKDVSAKLTYTADAAALKPATVHIITVPTPVDAAQTPDLFLLAEAGKAVGACLKRGDLVILESTVYPGATEEYLLPRLAKASGLKPGVDFSYGYAPERINPGDPLRQLREVVKVIAGNTPETSERMRKLYAPICGENNLYLAPSIAVAEAAKVMENTQRDLNIALINELALIADRLSIDTRDILATAGSKWNFLPFEPGLVGGHCIGVDPYYLTHRAAAAGYIPEVILAGRRVNNRMAAFVADKTLQLLAARGRTGAVSVNILGVTFKENVPDVRNSQVPLIKERLESFGAVVRVYDPVATSTDVKRGYGFDLAKTLQPADAVVLAVSHNEYRNAGWAGLQPYLAPKGVMVDVKAALQKAETPNGIHYWRL